MALFRKFFYRKPPDGLLEIVERVYVFDCCFTTDVVEDENYKAYISGIVGQLRGHLPDASFMVFNFREGENQSPIADILSEYDMTVIDYPRQYEGCPLLTMEMIHHCLRSGESWLLLGQNNVLLMHCERGGWPILSFMLAALLLYRKLYSGEQKTLDMIHKQAPRELLQLMSPLNPIPSQLRYLQYVSRRNWSSEWPPSDRALTLDCMIIRLIPNMDGEGGCRPIIRIYGQDPLQADDRTPKVLFSTPKRSRTVRHYKQAECELVKIDVHCHVLGDVVLECISLDEDLEREQMMFRVMFNSSFIRSNILMLSRDEIDTLWNSKEQFPKDFRTELLFSEMDAATSDVPVHEPVVEEKEGLPVEAFAKVQEIFSNVDWMDSKADVAHVLQHITASAILKEKLENYSHYNSETGRLDVSSPRELERQIKLQVLENKIKGSPSEALKKLSEHSLEAILDNDLIGSKTDTYQENASNICPQKLDTARPIVDTGIHSVSSPQQLNKINSEASNNVTASASIVPSPEAIKNEKAGQPGDLVTALQKSNQSKIISPRIVQSPRSSSGSYNNSVSSSPKPMQRFHNSSSPLGITALLHDHDTYKSDAVSPSVAESPQPSASLSSALPSPPVPPLPQSSAPPPPPPPPPPPQFSQPSTSESENDTALRTETGFSGKSHLKLPVSSPPSSPQAPSSITRKTSVSPPPPPPPPPPTPPSFNQGPHPLSSSQQSLPSNTDNKSACPPAPPPPPPPPPPSFGRSPSPTAGSTLPAPPPPPSPLIKQSPSSNERSSLSNPPPPPPPPLPGKFSSGADSSSSTPRTSGVGNAPPPPPPPPNLPGFTSSNNVPSSAPPPPPPPNLPSFASSNNVPSSAPPPPPPPSSNNVGSTSSSKVPPVPPPPGPGLTKQSQVPGSNGPVPPPPGPLGPKGRVPSRLNSRNQPKKANLKPYHWLKLTRVMQGSLWAETKSDEAAKAPEIDFSELENLFAASVPSSEKGKPGGASSLRASGPKSDKVQLIELRRAYNCEIMLSKVKIPLPDLMNSVLALDDSALDVDQVENLIKFCPTKEEMEQLKGYKGDKENLGKCEQFFLELMKVPRVESKLRVFSFKMQFNSQVSDLRKNLSIVNSASEEIRTSTRLKRIMQTILSLGNALNQGTARGSAVGFRLDSLLKLTDTRARNNKMTLMHYLCKVLAEKLPELLKFPKDLTNLEASTKIQLKFLAEEMQAISKGLEKVVQELTVSGNDGPISENFYKILKEFLAHAECEVRSLASLYSTVGRNADALAMYFGEDPAKVPFEQVVSTLLNFVRMFIRAHEENCKQLEFEKKKAQKAENEKLKTAARGKDSEQQHVRSPVKFQTLK